jgi:hypothetical protein
MKMTSISNSSANPKISNVAAADGIATQRIHEDDSVKREIAEVYRAPGLDIDFNSPPLGFSSNTDRFSYTYYWFK